MKKLKLLFELYPLITFGVILFFFIFEFCIEFTVFKNEITLVQIKLKNYLEPRRVI